MDKKLIYLISGRSASSKNPGRKISEIISVWSLKYNVFSVFGGDLFLGVGSLKNSLESYGSANYHQQSFRKSYLWTTFSEIKDIIHTFITLFHLIKNYKKEDVAIIWERSSRLHWAGLIFSKIKKIPYVLEWKDHLIPEQKSLLKRLARYIEKKKILEAEYVVIESNVLKNWIVNEYNIDSKKVLVALNAVNYTDFSKKNIDNREYSQKYNFKTLKTIVTYLGSFAFYHDSKRLVLAANILFEINPNITIYMIGDGKDKNECIILANELNISGKNIFFMPPVKKEEVPEILHNSDIAVLPGSTDIICPVKIMEYMAAGCVTIAPDYECNKEVIQHLKNGLLFKTGDEKSLAEVINQIANDKAIAFEISENGMEYAKTNLSWEITWGKTLDFIINENWD